MRFSIRIGSLVIRQLMTVDDAGATIGSDLIRINVRQAQLLYLGSFVNYNRYHIGDYFTNYTSMGLEDLLSSGSLHGPLSTIKTDGHPQIQFRSYLVSLKDRSWDQSCS